MILGDNIFHGAGLGRDIRSMLPASGAHIFTYEVSNPSDYGILEVDVEGNPISITEKPSHFISNLAVTGLYFFDGNVSEIAKGVTPSQRGELEITSIIEHYMSRGTLTYSHITRGAAWLDTGNPNSMHDAATYIRVIEERTGLKIACLEEIAFGNDWISQEKMEEVIITLGKSDYAKYLKKTVNHAKTQS
jgi:glucose-1-phosphate thymidylyltransferase